jgi:hypothetical protein
MAQSRRPRPYGGVPEAAAPGYPKGAPLPELTGVVLNSDVIIEILPGHAATLTPGAQHHHLTVGDFLPRSPPGASAPRDAWRSGRFTMDQLLDYARVCRVERVIRPYLESLVCYK